MIRHRVTSAIALSLILLATVAATGASAQALGSFRWQMQPFCNVVSVTVTQVGATYRLEGADDQCGAATQASVFGTAFPNPNGSIGFGFTVINSPGGAPLAVEATITLPSLSGTWRDSAGRTGPFTFTPGSPVPGAGSRPVAASLGAAAVDTTQVQQRVSGACPAGQSVRAVNQDGSVVCQGPPGVQFHVSGITSQQVPNQVPTTVNQWTTVLYNDGGGVYSPAAGTYTVPVTGLYHLSAVVYWSSFTTTAGHGIGISRGSSESLVQVFGPHSATTATNGSVQHVSTVRKLNAGDVLLVSAFQVSGAPRAIFGDVGVPHFAVTLLR